MPGNYDVVITADQRDTLVLAALPVTSITATTVLSTSVAPLTMATSASASATVCGTVTLAAVSATEVAYVAAKHSFASGPTAIVKFQGADLVSGAYRLGNLPLAAPHYTLYGATLPLVFASATSTVPSVGKYRVDVTAAGYTGMSIGTLDVSLINQLVVNLSMVP